MIRNSVIAQFLLILLILLMVAGCKPQPQVIDKEIAGTWISDKTSQKIHISFVGESIKVESWDSKDDERFEVSDIKWNGKELKVTFVMPSTGHTTNSIITQINSNRLQDSYEGDASGTMTWIRE